MLNEVLNPFCQGFVQAKNKIIRNTSILACLVNYIDHGHVLDGLNIS